MMAWAPSSLQTEPFLSLPSGARAPFRIVAILAVLLLLAAGSSGCSFRRMAVNKLGDALSAGGETYASDDDPELVKAAAPFSLKLMEALLAENPRHIGLQTATASGFTEYAYAFVQSEAEELEGKDVAAATALRARARRLYLRARNHGLRGLEARHPHFEQALRADRIAAVKSLRAADVPLLYWTAAAWAAAISVGKDTPDLVADLPLAEALMDRALELNEAFDDGAIHSFLITYEMSRQGGSNPAARARRHFQRAVELSHARQAAPFVALAEAVCVKEQNRAEFESLLQRALAIDPDQYPKHRLENLIVQRRARWLLAHAEDLILPPLPLEPKK